MRASAMLRTTLLALAAVVLPLVPTEAVAQPGFRITYDIDRTRPDRARLTGKVVNDRPEDVFEVSVTGEALDGHGKVLARGISFVDSRIGRGDARAFSMSVPTVPGVTNFRVVVSSFRTGFGGQAPSQGP
jgi:hypothetical protein